MNCKLIYRVNGMPVNIELTGVSNPSEAHKRVSDVLLAISNGQTIGDSLFSQIKELYDAKMNELNDNKKQITELKFDSILDIHPKFNTLNTKLEQFGNKFGFGVNVPVKIQFGNSDVGMYDPSDDSITITLEGQPTDDLGKQSIFERIKNLLAHEYVHYVLDRKVNFSDADVQSAYNEIAEVIKTRDLKGISNQLNVNQKIKEYLAKAISAKLVGGSNLSEKTYDKIKEILDKSNNEATSTQSFYKDQDSDVFSITNLDDKKLVSAINYNKVESAKAQDALEQIYGRFIEAKSIYDKNPYDVGYEKLVRNDDSDQFKINSSRLKVHDIVYVKNEDPNIKNSYDKYYPIIDTYFDRELNQNTYVLAVKKKDGTFTKIYKTQNDIIGYRKSPGVLLRQKVSKDFLNNVSESFKENLKFSDGEISYDKKGQVFDEEGNEMGKMVTISVKDGKKLISRQAIELRIGSNSSSDKRLMASLNQGSLINFEIKEKDGTKKRITAPLLRVLGNTIECLSKKGESYTIPFNKINSIIAFKDDIINQIDINELISFDESLSDYYNDKGISYSNFVYNDKTGKFKKVNSKYDYNQISQNNKVYHREDIDNSVKYVMQEFSKAVEDNDLDPNTPIKEFIETSNIDKEKAKYAKIYFNRQELLSTFTKNNAFVVYDYINKDGNTRTTKGKILHASKDLIYVYHQTSDGEGFIQKINIRDNVATKYKPSIRRVLFDNKQQYNLVDNFSKQQDSIKSNFDQMQELFSNDSYISDRKRKIDQIKEDNSQFFQGGKQIPTSLSDYYYYQYFDNSDENDYKSFYLGKLQKGDIVFREKNGYRNALVISDIDESGNIVGSSIIKNSSQEYYNGNMVNEIINPSTISAIGYNIYDNDEFDIQANQYFSKRYSVFKNKIYDFHNSKVFNTEQSAQRYADVKNKGNLKAVVVESTPVLDNNTNRIFYKETNSLAKIKSNNRYTINPEGYDKKYNVMLEFENGNTTIESQSANYFSRKMSTLSKQEQSNAFNKLKEGDVITLKDGDNYYNMIVTNTILGKDGNKKYKVESFYIDSNGNNKNIVRTVTEKNIQSNEKSNGIFKLYFDKFDKKRFENESFYSPNKNESTNIGEELRSYKQKDNYDTPFSKQTSGYNKTLDDFIYIKSISEQLNKLYGINFKLLTTNEIDDIYGNNFSKARAFVIGNEIIINSDNSSIAEPLHELTHIVLQMIRKEDYDSYNNMITMVRSHPEYQNIAKSYPELSGSKLDEEVFATVFGEYYAGKLRSESQKKWNNKNKGWFSNIVQKIKQIFNKFFGISERLEDIPDQVFMSQSLKSLMDKYGDNLIKGKYTSMIPMYNEMLSQKVDKLISILYSKEIIKKECYE